MTPLAPATPRATTPSGWHQVAATVILLVVVFSALLSAFALPPLHSGPHHVPLVVTGDAQGAEHVAYQLGRRQPGAFDIQVTANVRQARDRIADREAYGAIVVRPSGTRVLIATAASPAVGTLLRTLAARLAQQTGGPVPVTDIRPLPADDPNGVGLAAGALPLALGGWIGAVALLSLVRGAGRRVAGAIAFIILAAAALTALLRYGFGSLHGSYPLLAGGAALGVAATCWLILGLRTALGNAGLGVGAVTLILLGNPLSGLTSAPELLPAGWGLLGQLLPPGATGTLLRSLSFFDGAGSARPIIVLCCWLAGGIGLFVLGQARAARSAAREQQTPEVAAPQLWPADGRPRAAVTADGGPGPS